MFTIKRSDWAPVLQTSTPVPTGWFRRRSHRVSAELQSALGGFLFRLDGRVRLRVVGDAGEQATSWDTLRHGRAQRFHLARFRLAFPPPGGSRLLAPDVLHVENVHSSDFASADMWVPAQQASSECQPGRPFELTAGWLSPPTVSSSCLGPAQSAPGLTGRRPGGVPWPI